jgi:hypothetical protein
LEKESVKFIKYLAISEDVIYLWTNKNI